MKKIILVAGARPNFMKIAPILRAIEKQKSRIEGILVHTGQHYDHKMSGSFFDELGIKEPDYNLEVGSGSHAVQTAAIMVKFEEVCIKEKPDFVLVVGDVNSTVAAGLVAKKLNITLIHVEAGLRSGDREMPEEINRLATDAITDIFFTTEPEGTNNLLKEGQSPDKVKYVGHVMIDNLLYQKNRLEAGSPSKAVADLKKLLPSQYMCMTLHRPSNVDDKETLTRIIDAITEISQQVPVIFPCHPRTAKQMELFALKSRFTDATALTEPVHNGLFLTEPLSYNDFLFLWKDSTALLTDSGGLQEETTALKIPCITIRENTERPITVSEGSNILAGTNGQTIIRLAQDAINGKWKTCAIPQFWDGEASDRIIEIILTYLK